jgi:D-alanine-D-alanine ligase
MRVTFLVDSEVFDPSDPHLEAAYNPFLASMEQHIAAGLRKLRHKLRVVPFISDHRKVISDLLDTKADVVFNLAEHIDGDRRLSSNIPGMLEVLKIPYTGCSGIGMAMALDKALSKHLVSNVGFRIPKFAVLPDCTRMPQKLRFPVIVKPRFGGGSEGITLSSLVSKEEQMRRRASYINRTAGQPAICEEFITGRELSVAVVGNGPEVMALPIRETFFSSTAPEAPRFCTQRVKDSACYRKRWEITYGRAQFSPKIEAKILSLCRRAFLQLRLKGYARIDIRYTAEEDVFFLEANPNPDLSPHVFGLMAEWAGLDYGSLLTRILDLAIQRQNANSIFA